MTTFNNEATALPNMPATRTAHTPSGTTHVCEAHAKQIQTVMRMLGAHVNFTEPPTGAQCKNCENEALRGINASQSAI